MSLMSTIRRTGALAALAWCSAAAAAPVAWAANPPRPPALREGKADFHDKELALTYAFGPGALDFAFLDGVSLGVSTDQVFAPQNWYYRTTWRLVDNSDAGLSIALNGGVLQTREQLAGNQLLPSVFGWQAGFLVTLLTESGLTLRGGFHLYDTDWGAPEGQSFLFTPEVAYRMSILEITLVPRWPITFSLNDIDWIGLRLRF